MMLRDGIFVKSFMLDKVMNDKCGYEAIRQQRKL